MPVRTRWWSEQRLWTGFVPLCLLPPIKIGWKPLDPSFSSSSLSTCKIHWGFSRRRPSIVSPRDRLDGGSLVGLDLMQYQIQIAQRDFPTLMRASHSQLRRSRRIQNSPRQMDPAIARYVSCCPICVLLFGKQCRHI